MTQKMTLVAEDPDSLLKTVLKACKKVEPDFAINE
jgi:hypothetical protein